MLGATCEPWPTSGRRSHSCPIEPRRNARYHRRRALRAEQEVQALDWEVHEPPERDLITIARTDAQIRAAFPSSMFPPTYPPAIPCVHPVVDAPVEDPEDDILEAMRGMSVAEILAHIQDSGCPRSSQHTPTPAAGVLSPLPSPLPSPPSPSGTTWPPLPPGPPPPYARVANSPAKSSMEHWPPLQPWRPSPPSCGAEGRRAEG